MNQEELDILKEIQKNIVYAINSSDNLYNEPKLEIETFKIDITTAGQTVSVTGQTKIEHGKVLGIFTSCRGTADTNYNSVFKIEIDDKKIIADDYLQFHLFEKTAYNEIQGVAWKTDLKVDASRVAISYKDGSTLAVPYKAYVYLICRKKQSK